MSDGIERHQRQVVRGCSVVHVAAAQPVLHPVERRADDLLDRLQLLVDLERARLEARHVEQVAHEAVEAQRLFVRRLEQLAPGRLVLRGPCSSSSALVAPVTTASGVRRSCETELSSELRSCSVSMRKARAAGLLGELRALEGRADEAREGVEQLHARPGRPAATRSDG